MMIVPLTKNDVDAGTSLSSEAETVKMVGGKAASLMKLYSTPGLSNHVPEGFALTVDFFRPWCEIMMSSAEWKESQSILNTYMDRNESDAAIVASLTELCNTMKQLCRQTALTQAQERTLSELQADVDKWGLAAVRSSAPEEDGLETSFAGTFETKLGVTSATLETAVRECFASAFDFRVFSYVRSHSKPDSTRKKVKFAVVVMEMVDSRVAGVAFSANPINSDLDEMVVDSSWGLGESVVDGSIQADHFVWDKIKNRLIEKKVGKKLSERVLNKIDGGINLQPVDDSRQTQASLTDSQLAELAGLVSLVESTYGKPMDIEWAFVEGKGDNRNDSLEIVLLQARPITTIHRIDEHLITAPGAPRVLYYDFNIASEATTTSPFTYMDLTLYTRAASIMLGTPNITWFPRDPKMFFFNSNTRQFGNLSLWFSFPFITPEYCAEMSRTLDPYLADIFISSDCDRKKYRLKKLPPEVSFANAWFCLKQFPLWSMFIKSSLYASKPKECKEKYLRILEDDMRKIQELETRGMNKQSGGFTAFVHELFEAATPSLLEEVLGSIPAILPVFHQLAKKRLDMKQSENQRLQYDALCSGYEGDELMKINIAMYRLARKLPESVWSEYDNKSFKALAKRIESNLEGITSDLPSDFIEEWVEFMQRYGYDGQDQLFVSSPRYADAPEMLLAILRHNVDKSIKDPAETQQAKLMRRREVMAMFEDQAKRKYLNPFALSRIRKRNELLEHLMWIRNSPKLRISRLNGIIRKALLQLQSSFIEEDRLDEEGDIFHLSAEEVDKAVEDETLDLKTLVRPRKIVYEKAKKAKVCPMLFDSRCRILAPDSKVDLENDQDTLVGTPISSGIASGKVRVIEKPTDRMEKGEVLVAFVTDPAWTPLFAGASAVVLQVGGVLQHGALCAREYGVPAVSGVMFRGRLKTGMMVRVDGNTGVVKILED